MDMEIGLAKINKDGAVTIPYSIRKRFKTGEQLVVLADEKRVTLKRVSDVSSTLLAFTKEPSAKGSIRPAAKPPIKMPKRDKFGHFLPAKKAPAAKKR